jgi:Protein of unknown function (DUF2840)
MTKLYPSFIHQSALDPRFLVDNLTHVELVLRPRKIEQWLRFGKPFKITHIDKKRRVASFKPFKTFAFVRFASIGKDRIIHRLDIVETMQHDDDYETLPFVRPGGFIMLSLNTVERVDEALRIIDLIEFGGVPLTEVPARYWLELDSSLKCNKKPPTYTLQDHQEWLKKTKELS